MDGDREALRQEAHSLKGAALNMGCRGLAEAAASLSADPDAAAHEIRSRVSEVARQSDLAKKAILNELPKEEG